MCSVVTLRVPCRVKVLHQSGQIELFEEIRINIRYFTVMGSLSPDTPQQDATFEVDLKPLFTRFPKPLGESVMEAFGNNLSHFR